MSFILDALKKSEKQRQQKEESTPVRRRTLSASAKKTKTWPLWFFSTSTIAVVLSFILWFYNLNVKTGLENQTEKVSKQGAIPINIETRSSSQVTETPTPQTVQPVQESSPVPQTNDVEIIVTTANDEPVNFEPKEVPATKATESQSKSLAPSRTLVAREVPEPEKIILSYLDLPRELRAKMPRLAISMHFYISEPARRMVRVNNLLLREGDYVSDDLRVVEITHKGAIIDYLGTYFELSSSH